jgi:hypothetical protein
MSIPPQAPTARGRPVFRADFGRVYDRDGKVVPPRELADEIRIALDFAIAAGAKREAQECEAQFAFAHDAFMALEMSTHARLYEHAFERQHREALGLDKVDKSFGGQVRRFMRHFLAVRS